MVKMVWEKYSDNAITQGGDPLWKCPICNRGVHICKMGQSDGKTSCPDCRIPLRYPWEEE